MTVRRALVVAVAFGLAVLIATAAFEVVTYLGLKRTQTRIAHTQYTFAVSQKASTQTRVQTVSQRCDLTRQLVMAFADKPRVAAGFAKSLTKCQLQLKAVKAINAHTPSPKPLRRGVGAVKVAGPGR